jgi:hypothetical protein
MTPNNLVQALRQKKKEKGLVYKIVYIKGQEHPEDNIPFTWCRIEFKPHTSLHTIYHTPQEILNLGKQWQQYLILEMALPALIGTSYIEIHAASNIATSWGYHRETSSTCVTAGFGGTYDRPDFKEFTKVCKQTLLVY